MFDRNAVVVVVVVDGVRLREDGGDNKTTENGNQSGSHHSAVRRASRPSLLLSDFETPVEISNSEDAAAIVASSCKTHPVTTLRLALELCVAIVVLVVDDDWK